MTIPVMQGLVRYLDLAGDPVVEGGTCSSGVCEDDDDKACAEAWALFRGVLCRRSTSAIRRSLSCCTTTRIMSTASTRL